MKGGNPVNQVGRRTQTAPASGPPFPKFQARRLRTETDFIGFAGRRTQTAPASGPPFPKFQARRLRTETEFTDFAGSRTQTAPASGPPSPIFQARRLRTETEFIGFPGRRTQTPPAPGSPFPKFQAQALIQRKVMLEAPSPSSITFLLSLIPSYPSPQHREVHLKKRLIFLIRFCFPNHYLKKVLFFFNSQDWIKKLPSFLPSSQRLLCNSISTNV